MSSVSVIVPAYNCGHFIGEAIESILAQTRVPEQIIIVDDGSTDNTAEVVGRYKDRRIEYIRYADNQGVSTARNVGLVAAQGDFVAFLDADDRWRPTYLERMREFLIADPGAVCAFANFVRFDDETGNVMGDQFSCYPELREPELQDEPPSIAIGSAHKAYAFNYFVSMGEIPAFTVVMMFRRSMITDLRFDARLKVCEDTHFALRAFMRGNVPYTREVLCEVRRHGANATREHHEIAVHKLRALKALAPFVGDTDLDAYYDRLVKAHIDAAIYQTRSGQIGAGVRSYLDSLAVPRSAMRKVKGSVRVALALPRGLMSA